MSSSSKPRHGETVINIKSAINNIPGSMTPQFQEFIDEIDATISAVAKLVIKDVTVTEAYTQDREDSRIFANASGGNFPITMIDPADAFKQTVLIKNETGSLSQITLIATVGTIEVTTLQDEEWAVFAPRPDLVTPANSKWAQIG